MLHTLLLIPRAYCGRPLLEAASSCELSPLSTLTAREGSTLVLGRFDQVGTAAMAAAAASNAVEIADGEGLLSPPAVINLKCSYAVPMVSAVFRLPLNCSCALLVSLQVMIYEDPLL